MSGAPPAKAIFVGVNVVHTKGNRSLRSQVMKEHYRRKREAQATKTQSGESSQARSTPLAQASGKTLTFNSRDSFVTDDSGTASLADFPTSPTGHTPPEEWLAEPPDYSDLASDSLQLSRSDGQEKVRQAANTLIQSLQNAQTGMHSIFVDPLGDIGASLDPESRRHFRRYFSLPNMSLDLNSDTLTCKVYNIHLAVRFPILQYSFAAYSSAKSIDSAVDRQVTIKATAETCAQVNALLSKPNKATYNTILLGIQGAIGSAAARRDGAEFTVHRRGQTTFLRSWGLPTDPDVMIHIVANSLMYGRAISRDGIDDPNGQDTARLMAMLRRIHRSVGANDTPRHASPPLLEAYTTLLGPGSTIHTILHQGPEDSRYPARVLVDIAHRPFLFIYLHLFLASIATESLQHQFNVLSSLAEQIRTGGVAKRPTAATINWFLLIYFKEDMGRTWAAYEMVQVMLRLSRAEMAKVLGLMREGLWSELGAQRASAEEVESWAFGLCAVPRLRSA